MSEEGAASPVILFDPIAIFPDIVPPALGSFVAMLFVTVVAKFESAPSASDNSLSVSSVDGAPLIRLVI